MAARRCQLHGINYPVHIWHCAACKALGLPDDLKYIYEEDEDDDWEARAMLFLDRALKEEFEEALIPKVEADVRADKHGLWVSSWDVYRGVGKRLQWTDLFRISQQIFEVLEYVHKRREYLVRLFSDTLTNRDLKRFCKGCGGVMKCD